jgi:Ca2+-binding EF-hand superfamily protein
MGLQQAPVSGASADIVIRANGAGQGSMPLLQAKIRETHMELSAEQEDQIVEAFRLFDTDDSGILDEAELRSAMFALGYIASYHDDISRALGNLRRNRSIEIDRESDGGEIDRDCANSNTNAPGGISLAEFRNIMRGSLIDRGGLEEIRMTFDVIVSMSAPDVSPSAVNLNGMSRPPMQTFSHNNAENLHPPGAIVGPVLSDVTESRSDFGSTGITIMRTSSISEGPCINFDMLRRVCQRFDVRLTDDELRRVIEETDRDGSGDVDWAEYVNVLKNSCWF